MDPVPQTKVSGAAATCITQAASFLAECSRPALDVSDQSTPEQFCSALADVVSAAELFGCKPSFWRWAADAAELLGHAADAETYHQRFLDRGKV
jgi:hypothetical protein